MGWVVSFTHRSLYLRGEEPWHPRNSKLGRHQNQSGGFADNKNLLSLTGIKLQHLKHLASSLVTTQNAIQVPMILSNLDLQSVIHLHNNIHEASSEFF
jgi:hypothetical protein